MIFNRIISGNCAVGPDFFMNLRLTYMLILSSGFFSFQTAFVCIICAKSQERLSACNGAQRNCNPSSADCSALRIDCKRVWGVLKSHWKGQLLDSVEKVIGLAKTMKYNGKNPVVKLISGTYEKGIKLAKEAIQQVENMIERLTSIQKWAIDILRY